MKWVLIIGVAWLAVSVVTALLIGAAIRLADQRRSRPREKEWDNVVVDEPPVPGLGPGRPSGAARLPAGKDGAPEAGRPASPAANGTR